MQLLFRASFTVFISIREAALTYQILGQIEFIFVNRRRVRKRIPTSSFSTAGKHISRRNDGGGR